MKNIFDIIADDHLASSFQSLGQYRSYLLKTIPKYKYKDFEDFLTVKFVKDNPMLLDDDWPDAWEEWIVDCDPRDLIKWANDYANLKGKP